MQIPEEKKSLYIKIGVGVLGILLTATLCFSIFSMVQSASSVNEDKEKTTEKTDSKDKKKDTDKKQEEKDDTKHDDKKKEDKTEEKREETKKDTDNNVNKNTNTQNPSNSTENNTQKQENTPHEHVHQWERKEKETYIEPVYEEKYVVDKPAWEEALYEWIPHYVCNGCGIDLGTYENAVQHMKETLMNGDTTHTYTDTPIQVFVGYKHHPEQGHTEKVVKTPGKLVVESWLECECGAKK